MFQSMLSAMQDAIAAMNGGLNAANRWKTWKDLKSKVDVSAKKCEPENVTLIQWETEYEQNFEYELEWIIWNLWQKTCLTLHTPCTDLQSRNIQHTHKVISEKVSLEMQGTAYWRGSVVIMKSNFIFGVTI